ncbi:hypothetical protein [Haliscomenobacter sp.]|uniref:hypothetical protein n=1 Tax=Haliscomenobacter sp. TaxID=2717303 RepID=UPI003593FCBD
MKKYFLWWYPAVFCLLMSLTLSGQSTFSTGFRYQAMLRDAASQGIVNQEVTLKISIKSNNEAHEGYYSEIQKVLTDQNGRFELMIGKGEQKNGVLTALPWASEQLWLQIEMAQKETNQFDLVSKSPLLAVPYAMHAATTSALYDPSILDDDQPIEKSGFQSIYWTTSGNLATNPNVHFVGTKDNANLVFKTNNKAFLTLTTLGKLELISEVAAGPDHDKSFYPVVVEGANNTQGVWVEINGSRSKSNNFVTFADDIGVQGRIEGQTLSELEASDSYATMVAVTTLNAAALVGKIAEISLKIAGETASGVLASVICGVSLGTIACSDVPALVIGAVASGVKLDVWVVELASYLTATGTSFDRIRSAVGVSYSSGAGDYAEWLLRNKGERDMVYGEIVGVNGGVASLNTAHSSRNMVVSAFPAFLGKTPAPGSEDKFEKIAFMGQVPVRVMGKVKAGDYILPSGNNDGFGIAVNPDALSIADYAKIVGVAWESAENNLPFNLINAGVGIKSNALAGKVDEIERKLDQALTLLGEKDVLDATSVTEDPALALTGTASTPTSVFQNNIMDDAAFDRNVDLNAALIKKLFAGTAARLKGKGYDLSHPVLAQMFNDPVNTLKRMHRNPNEFLQQAMVNR